MNRESELAQTYSAVRPRLIRVAYAVLGSQAEAEDVVSDCWLRLVGADARDQVLDVEAWCTVAVARLALDTLRSARVRRETYIGPWLPEPLLTELPDSTDPADRVTLDDSMSYALLIALEALTPAERTSWVLHDLFGLAFDEIATVVGRSPAAVRQLATRARRHVADGARRLEIDAAEHHAVVAAFVQAAAGGDLAALVTVLDPQVVLTSDGGGVVSAARRPVYGADRVARFVLGILAKAGAARRTTPVLVNGLAGLLTFDNGLLDAVTAFTVQGGRVVRVDLIRSPAKLAAYRPFSMN